MLSPQAAWTFQRPLQFNTSKAKLINLHFSKSALLSMVPDKAKGTKHNKTSKPKQTWKTTSPLSLFCSVNSPVPRVRSLSLELPQFRQFLLVSRSQVSYPISVLHTSSRIAILKFKFHFVILQLQVFQQFLITYGIKYKLLKITCIKYIYISERCEWGVPRT